MVQFSLDLTVGALLRPRTLLGFRSTYGHVGHLHYFTKKLALAMLEDLGYEIIEVVYTLEPIPPADLFGKVLSLPQRAVCLE